MGYYRAGFEVIGVDLAYQRRYPFTFVHADALVALRGLLAGEPLHGHYLDDFDAIHASPPCQAHSDLQKQSKIDYPDFIAPTRALLQETGKPWVIENVDGAPLIDPIVLCGTMFDGLRVLRHRLFESNVELSAPDKGCGRGEKHPLVFTYDQRKPHFGKLNQDTSYVQVTGGGNCSVRNKKDAMGIYWMIGTELNEAIPPAYTEHIGKQIKEVISDGKDAQNPPPDGRVQHAGAHPPQAARAGGP